MNTFHSDRAERSVCGSVAIGSPTPPVLSHPPCLDSELKRESKRDFVGASLFSTSETAFAPMPSSDAVARKSDVEELLVLPEDEEDRRAGTSRCTDEVCAGAAAAVGAGIQNSEL